MSTSKSLIVIGVFALLAGGCGDDSPGSNTNNGTNTNNNVTPGLVGAPGVAITSVALYQGPKCVIMNNGLNTQCDVPLINGRDGLLRVFYSAAPAAVGQTYTARLTIDAAHTYEVTGNFVPTSNEENMASTANFVLPGEAINQFLAYKVELLQDGTPADDNPQARFPQTGVQPVTVDGVINTFRVIIAPFAYWADGSGRVPNLTPARVEEFRNRFLQLYPVTNAEVSVRDAYDWNQTLGSDGTGWQQLGMTLAGFRNQDGTSDDVYYYGIFNPAASFGQYCGMGCLLGVTLLNDNPPDTGSVQLRIAIGVGFDEYAVDTAAHEIGHSHGRRHAPCGLGVEDIDPAYPYAGGLIGVWSWDIVGEQLFGPEDKTDIMSYCENQWISDYNYKAWYARGMNVNLPWFHDESPIEVSYKVVSLDGQGGGVIQPGVRLRSHKLNGTPLEVFVQSKAGRANTITGQYFYWDHLPGGWLFVPEQTFRLDRVELVVEGLPTIAERPLLP
ncbi:MAG: hypothetical protein ABI333_29680 [bacterium]